MKAALSVAPPAGDFTCGLEILTRILADYAMYRG